MTRMKGRRTRDEGRGKTSHKKQSLWKKFGNFVFTFELTPENIHKSLSIKRKTLNVKHKRKLLILFFVLSFTFLSLLVLFLKDIPSPRWDHLFSFLLLLLQLHHQEIMSGVLLMPTMTMPHLPLTFIHLHLRLLLISLHQQQHL